jgi:hypothetical protein
MSSLVWFPGGRCPQCQGRGVIVTGDPKDLRSIKVTTCPCGGSDEDRIEFDSAADEFTVFSPEMVKRRRFWTELALSLLIAAGVVAFVAAGFYLGGAS